METNPVNSVLTSHADAPKRLDTVIIGGSVAGLFTAYLLAQNGATVHLFDANDVMHVHPRTLIATAQLEEVLGFFPAGAIVNQVRTIELMSAGRQIKVDLPRPDLVVERSAMIRILAQKAVDAGVKLWSGHKFLGFEPSSNGLRLRVQDKHIKRTVEFTTQNLVGADGAFSQVANAAQMNGLARVALLQAIVEPPDGCDAANVQVWFEPRRTPYFFWFIPEGKNRAAVGFIAEDSTTAKAKLREFLQEKNFRPLQIQAAWIPLFATGHRPWKQISGCDIYLVGDAAGHVKVTTVGGLVTGLWGARAAAEAIHSKTDYQKTLRSLERELFLHGMIRRALNRFSPRDYDKLLHTVNDATAMLLGRYTRDELTKMAAKLLLAQPRLLGFLTHILLPGRARNLPLHTR